MPKSEQSSSTAETVLAGVWLTACDPKTRDLVSGELATYAEHALHAIGSPLAWALRFPLVRSLARSQEARVLPGICTHYVQRKQRIMRLVQEVAASRLVVLGAGLDGLAYRLAERMEAVEVDWPATQIVKRRILNRLELRRIALIEGDFSDPDYSLEIGDSKIDATVAVAEGVLMYLTERSVRNLFRQVAQNGKNFVFTFVALDKNRRPAFAGDTKRVDRYLARAKEPFLWGIDPGELEQFLAPEGWTLQATYGAAEPSLPRLEVVEGMIPGEWIAHASVKTDR